MKILMINSVCGILSTGRICTDLALELEKKGHTVKIAYGRKKVPSKYDRFAVRIGYDVDVALHVMKARLIDGCGWGSKKVTEKFVKWIIDYDPDVIHLHNLHGYYINVEVLFKFLHTLHKKIIWTLHDCWSFTGHAACCDKAGCNKWISGCNKCINQYEYPCSFLDRSYINWQKKKKLFQGINDMQIVTPSEWLSKLVAMSFLSKYPVKVINNGINTNLFKKNIDNGRVIDKILDKIIDKTVVLGVASVWNDSKGLNDFIKLNEMLDETHQIILIGLNKKQLSYLPRGVIGIERTDSIEELVQYYSLANVFVNPTYEDNYPTTNLEAISCGIPVITYDTGGSPESAKSYGEVVPRGDILALSNAIKNYKQIKSAPALGDFSVTNMVKRYIDVYEL